MSSRRALGLALLLAPFAGSSVAAQSDDSVRTHFLALIDRPRPQPFPTVKPLADLPGGLVEERITFASDGSSRVPAILVKRAGATGKRPVVIVLHATGGNKEGELPLLQRLAAAGFIAIAPDGPFHGERATGGVSYNDAMTAAFSSGIGHPFLYDTVWDVMRLIDYLVTREDVDAARIGLTGFSKGGMETYLAAAVDTRIAASVPMHGVQSFRWGLDHGAWDSRAWSIRQAVEAAAASTHTQPSARFLRTFYDRIAPGIYGEFDGPSMVKLVAPRPMLIINGDSDPRTPLGGTRECETAARSAYAAQGAADHFELTLEPNTGHELTPGAEQAMIAWFARWLKP